MKTLRPTFWFVVHWLATVTVNVEAKDVAFESSDGGWSDATDDFNGRGFYSVLWTFEHYKLKENRPEATLVRLTPKPKFSLFRSQPQATDPKWKVPMGEPSGHATSYRSPYEKGELDEIRRRADAALAYWKSR